MDDRERADAWAAGFEAGVAAVLELGAPGADNEPCRVCGAIDGEPHGWEHDAFRRIRDLYGQEL